MGLSLADWLTGMVDYNVPEATIHAIAFNNGVSDPASAAVTDVTEAVRMLSLADLYVWLSTSSSTSSGEYESDGGWQRQKSAKNVVNRNGLREMANRIYAKYDKSRIVKPGVITMKPLYSNGR